MTNFSGHSHAHHFDVEAGMEAFDKLPRTLRDFLNYDGVPWSPPAVAEALNRYRGECEKPEWATRLLVADLRRQLREMTKEKEVQR